MGKELHIYMGENYPYRNGLFITLEATERALFNNEKTVNTTQTHVCSIKWIEKGYRIFVHMLDNSVAEIKLGKNDTTDREIRPGHNIEKLMLAGEFGTSVLNFALVKELRKLKEE